jgi:hypothetical protein
MALPALMIAADDPAAFAEERRAFCRIKMAERVGFGLFQLL